MTRRACSLALSCLVVCQLGERLDAVQKDSAAATLRVWLSAVNQHAAGAADAPLIDVGSWPVDQAFATINDFVALVRGRRDAQAKFAKTGRASDISLGGTRYSIAQLNELFGLTETEARQSDVNRPLERAVVFYTDLATFEAIVPRASRGSRIGGPPRIPLILDDGRASLSDGSGADRAVLWGFARVLADEVSPQRDAEIALWYHAVAALLEQTRQWGLAAAHDEQGRKMRPTDPDLVFRLGVVHEFLAGPQAQAARQTLSSSSSIRIAVEPELDELRHAEEAFRATVRLSPDWAEARLHFGHVLGALGHDDEAVAELSRASDTLTNPELRYDLQLCLGRSQAAMGDRAEARASYDRAAAAFPLAETPLLALSELARHAGDGPAAIAALERLLNLPENRPDDPWWTYDTSSSRDADLLMTQALAALGGARRP